MADLKKSLFVPGVPPEKLNPHFKSLVDAPSYHPTRNMLDLTFQDFDDPDGNFLQQFQTTGFDSRLFALYLFGYFSNSGFEVDRTHRSPDYLIISLKNHASGGYSDSLGVASVRNQFQFPNDFASSTTCRCSPEKSVSGKKTPALDWR